MQPRRFHVAQTAGRLSDMACGEDIVGSTLKQLAAGHGS